MSYAEEKPYATDPGPEQGPTVQEECGWAGHPYYGDQYPDDPSGNGGRCACGTVSYRTGGPK